MMSELDWESLLAIDGQQKEELRRFRIERGLEPAVSDPGPGHTGISRQTQSDTTSLAPGIGFGRKTKQEEKRTPPKVAAQSGKWDAKALILDEEEEAADELDLLFYQLRKKYAEVSHDDKLEQKLRSVPDPIPEWTADTAASVRLKYLSIAQQLSKGQITDSAQREMILLSSSSEDTDPGMKQFYPVFTLLQSGPSREHISNVLGKADPGPAGGESAEALRILCGAVRDAVRKQDALDEAQDSRYRSRQGRLNAARGKAQSDYDSAKKEADRWRKGNE